MDFQVAVHCIVRSPVKLLIPSKWVGNRNLVHEFFGGVKPYEIRKIFISSDLAKEPNFALPVSLEIDKKTDCCVEALVLKGFGVYLRLFNLFPNATFHV